MLGQLYCSTTPTRSSMNCQNSIHRSSISITTTLPVPCAPSATNVAKISRPTRSIGKSVAPTEQPEPCKALKGLCCSIKTIVLSATISSPAYPHPNSPSSTKTIGPNTTNLCCNSSNSHQSNIHKHKPFNRPQPDFRALTSFIAAQGPPYHER